jgi:hypothetical protein
VEVVSVRCMYKKCPGLDLKSKRKVSYKTIYQCEEYSVDEGSPLWLCHTTKNINGKHTVASCHLRYHSEKKFIVTDSTESSVISDLTEELILYQLRYCLCLKGII